MTEALVYLHEKLFMLHADCHGDNFMITTNLNKKDIVLSDFTTARVVGKNGEMSKDIPRNPSGRCFKPLGCAPEHTLDQSYSFNGDTFFLATTFSMMSSPDRKMCFELPNDPRYCNMLDDPIPHIPHYKVLM